MDFRLKSQVALEFVLLVGIAFMVMVIFAVLTRGSMVDMRGEEEYVALKDVMHTVQGEIITATVVEDGYKRTFTIPLALGGINYTIGISTGYLIGESRNHEYVLQISQTNGSISKGVNVIRKEGGVVYINQ